MLWLNHMYDLQLTFMSGKWWEYNQQGRGAGEGEGQRCEYAPRVAALACRRGLSPV